MAGDERLRCLRGRFFFEAEAEKRGGMGAKPHKVEKVKELTQRFKEASGAMFADFRGLSVKDAMELRRTLRDADTSLMVTKNTLTRIAVKDAGLDEQILELLEGPTAIAFIAGDPISGAKALVDSSRRFPALVVKGAVVEGRVLLQDQAQALATLDTKDVSFAKVAGQPDRVPLAGPDPAAGVRSGRTWTSGGRRAHGTRAGAGHRAHGTRAGGARRARGTRAGGVRRARGTRAGGARRAHGA
jgi:large subunit ribosomal protein L10